MNLGQVRTYVRSLIAEDVAAFWTDAVLNTFIQRSFMVVYTKVANMRRGYFEQTATISYVAAQELYTLPSGSGGGGPLIKLVLVERIDSLVPQPVNIRMIDIIQKNDYALLTNVDIVPGNEVYFMSGNSLGVAPIPQTAVPAALKLWFVPTPVLPTADGDTFPTELTDVHHEVIAWGAVIRAVMRDKQLLSQLLPLYNELKELLNEDTQVRSQQEPPRVIDTDPWSQ